MVAVGIDHRAPWIDCDDDCEEGLDGEQSVYDWFGANPDVVYVFNWS
ncbi:hypothetical protein KKG41_01285 [Patescibacteria group bacterium]|nr:hypothetical protein [Patescibacteria group bacterium]MBU1889869.1 hypothetical protein [Patescibacteria group bacterium]